MTTLNFLMLTMFLRSILVDQARKKNWQVYYFSIYSTPPLEDEQKAYCPVCRPGQNVTVCFSQAEMCI